MPGNAPAAPPRRRGPAASRGRHASLDEFEAPNELVRRLLEALLGVHPKASCKVHEGKEKIAQFLLPPRGITISIGMLQLVDLLPDLLENARVIRPVKANPDRLSLDLLGTLETWKMPGHVCQDRAFRFFTLFLFLVLILWFFLIFRLFFVFRFLLILWFLFIVIVLLFLLTF